VTWRRHCQFLDSVRGFAVAVDSSARIRIDVSCDFITDG
jgi:hypothetical protein